MIRAILIITFLINFAEIKSDLILITTKLNADSQEQIITKDLHDYLTDLMTQGNDINDLIINKFGNQNPITISALIQLLDPINLAITIFKQYFTLDEIKAIVDFNTSPAGRKFGQIFPVVMTNYAQALDAKMTDLELVIQNTNL